MKKYSKKQLAKGYLALRQHAPRRAATALAAALLSQRSIRDLEIVVREIGRLLLTDGHALVNISTARPATASQQHALEAVVRQRTGATVVHAEYTTNPALHGGFVITTPTETIDGSLSGVVRRLTHSSTHRHG